ncbi:secernin-2-like isoform X1 [Centruroides sculpturatus]|uniref:secernin-2-like isoform X1 n=2 Tax=Centruroides sculpturatus TaxID=218467 RepID=UPI000C6EE89E|nr:secernin-2-like isoform X1 [Centruroides sculpturatus]
MNFHPKDMASPKLKCSSCDTFVVLPPVTANNFIIFGKNSDRPSEEVQEVVYVSSRDYSPGTKLKCTYIEIDQVQHSYAVILSKPAWMWGAEMGANEHGVCIGNEAVWTALNSSRDNEKALLGMDLLRLGLERSNTAREALDVITQLLEKYGQGGPCSDIMPSFTYHNSFLIVDRKEAWILETAGKLWAAEHVTSGFRNISNSLSIHTKIDLMSENLKEYAMKHKLWHLSQGEFDFAEAFGDGTGDDPRFKSGRQLLAQHSVSKDFSERHMMKILRDTTSGICMCSGSFVSTASQVSVLPSIASKVFCYHFFTATPDPLRSMFKPFMFIPNIQFTEKTVSPTYMDPKDSTKIKSSYEKYLDRSHYLYKVHRRIYSNLLGERELQNKLKKLEDQYIEKTRKLAEDELESSSKASVYTDAVNAEIELYESI